MDYFRHNAAKAGMPDDYVPPKLGKMPSKDDVFAKAIRKGIDVNRESRRQPTINDPWHGAR